MTGSDAQNKSGLLSFSLVISLCLISLLYTASKISTIDTSVPISTLDDFKNILNFQSS